MRRLLASLSVLCLVSLTSMGRGARAQEIGTDLAALNLCLYGDCEARGSYAADPYGWANPGTLPVGSLPYVPRGVLVSGSYFRLNVGDIGADIGGATVALTYDPFVFEVHTVYAEAGGGVRSVPGVDLSARIRFVGLGGAVDLGRTRLGVKGLSVGLIMGLPVTDSDLRLSAAGISFLQSTEERQVDLTVGAHWRSGERDWFAVGAFVNALRSPTVTTGIDPSTFQPFRSEGTSHAWFTRAGTSLLPFVPLRPRSGSPPIDKLLDEVRVGADVAYTNVTVPAEGTRSTAVGYFGVDAPVLPDTVNPLSRFVRPVVIAGVDTEAGWGIGAGIYGNGPLEFFSCNPAYSSRPLTQSLGGRVDVWSATCAAAIPF